MILTLSNDFHLQPTDQHFRDMNPTLWDLAGFIGLEKRSFNNRDYRPMIQRDRTRSPIGFPSFIIEGFSMAPITRNVICSSAR